MFHLMFDSLHSPAHRAPVGVRGLGHNWTGQPSILNITDSLSLFSPGGALSPDPSQWASTDDCHSAPHVDFQHPGQHSCYVQTGWSVHVQAPVPFHKLRVIHTLEEKLCGPSNSWTTTRWNLPYDGGVCEHCVSLPRIPTQDFPKKDVTHWAKSSSH